MAKRKPAAAPNAGDDEKAGADVFHPRYTNRLFGHAAAEETFLSAFRSGALHHAWLLTGEEGIGKATFAYLAARFLLTLGELERAAGDEAGLAAPATLRAARQIAAGAHPSLFVLSDASAGSIGVDAVRKLRGFLGLTSPGVWRVMIVDPANGLTAGSANALLKAIEEPPPNTVFFLVSHGAADVMPTIRSRCVRLSFRPLGSADFGAAISAACRAGDVEAPDGEQLARLYGASAGSPGRALDLFARGLLPIEEKLDRILAGVPKLDFKLVHALIQSVSGARNAEIFASLCDLIERRVEENARKAALGSHSGGGTAAAWAGLWQRFQQRRAEMEGLNLDKGAFLMTAFSDMEHIARTAADSNA
jgi:DNA polymerase III subunit delta'